MSVARLIVPLLLVALPTAGWAASTKERLQSLEQQVATLEQQVAEQQAACNEMLEQKLDALSKQLDEHFATMEKKIAESAMSGEAREQKAQAMLGEVNRMVAAGNYDLAKKKMDELRTGYASTNTYRRARGLQQELAVIGKNAPSSLSIEEWYQGDVDVSSGKAMVVVFWEIWCPHCKREVPKMQKIYDNYKDKGLQMVGLTKITRSATEEQVREFIETQKVAYPMAKETGEASSYFNVSTIPAAAVVKDGKIVWRGHPARLSTAMIESWL